jgi:hypothetical protein
MVQVAAHRNSSSSSHPGGNAIDGYLVLDARNGKMKCAGLPFLD